MGLEQFANMSDKESNDFSKICNYLLSCTFVMREGDNGLMSKDYRYIERNFELFVDYLSLSGWRIYKDTPLGVIYVRNTDGYNKLTLDKLTTVMIATLRIIYEERRAQASNMNNVCITIGELFGKIVNDFSVYPKKPPQKEIKNSFRIFERHNLLYKLDESYDDLSCRIVILPSILIAVSSEKCKAIGDTLKSIEEDSSNEEDDEAVTD